MDFSGMENPMIKTIRSTPVTKRLATTASVLLPLFSPLTAFGQTSIEDCELKYPVVLSHHFGLRTICPDSWTPDECMTREGDNLAKYCADWSDDEGCLEWVLPEDEADLPPRVDNLYD